MRKYENCILREMKISKFIFERNEKLSLSKSPHCSPKKTISLALDLFAKFLFTLRKSSTRTDKLLKR
jgi:hypothetical protein